MTPEQLNKTVKVLNRLVEEGSISRHEYNLIYNLLIDKIIPGKCPRGGSCTYSRTCPGRCI